MNTSIAALKRSKSNLDTLVSELNKVAEPQKQKQSYADDRFWKPELDKSGNGYAVIRFLPSPEGEEIPWAKMYSHAFQGPGGWYIENSLTTTGGKDPVSEHNRELWNSGNESDKDVVRRQKRKLSYYANIYVVKDPANPATEGKVYLYKFGAKIFDKIMAAMQPEFEDESPINPFDFWQGADFKLKIRKVDGYWNYDKSEFAAPAPLLKDDDAMEAIWKTEYSLQALVAADQFKSYEDLNKRLDYVLGVKKAPARVDVEVRDEDDARGSYKPDFASRKVAEEAVSAAPAASNDEEDDAMSYFQKLAES